MEGIPFTASTGSRTIATADGDIDLIQILVPATAVIELTEFEIFQTSDMGDAQSEALEVQFCVSTMAVNGSGGVVLTPQCDVREGLASLCTVEAHNTTLSTVTTVKRRGFWNLQAGMLWTPQPMHQFVISPGDGLVIHLPVAPTDDVTGGWSVSWMELGGA